MLRELNYKRNVPGLHLLVFLSVYNKFNEIFFECFDTVEAGSTCCFSFAIHVSADS
jgi:hypothetical protein